MAGDPFEAPVLGPWFEDAMRRVRDDPKALAIVLPSLARRAGRAELARGRIRIGEAEIERGAWRTCDVAGHRLIEACAIAHADLDDSVLHELFLHGDFEERVIVLRHVSLLPIQSVTIALLGEVQRTNTAAWFEALVCDNDLLARAVASGRLPRDDAYKILLKGAFVDLRLHRFYGIEHHASAELTRFVTGLATEREAAGRAVWVDTNRLVAHAPIEGSVDRVLRGLEDSRAEYRHASVDGLAVLLATHGDARLNAAARGAFERESDPGLRVRLSELI
ncbi:MAG: EboA domain-containing protein [Planctomycetes bacterium]|nr:EboA domain-containing protein [Planctomycetota bacterium]MCB9917990.1 EboA domain-containing protein [Planctomycetota bacterium]